MAGGDPIELWVYHYDAMLTFNQVIVWGFLISPLGHLTFKAADKDREVAAVTEVEVDESLAEVRNLARRVDINFFCAAKNIIELAARIRSKTSEEKMS